MKKNTYSNFLFTFFFKITKLKIDSNPFAKGFRDSTRLTEFERYLLLLSHEEFKIMIS